MMFRKWNEVFKLYTYTAFTLATSELCQTGLVRFSEADISRTTGTWQVPVSLLISAFKNGTKPVWHSSEVASVNAVIQWISVALENSVEGVSCPGNKQYMLLILSGHETPSMEFSNPTVPKHSLLPYHQEPDETFLCREPPPPPGGAEWGLDPCSI